MEHYSFDDSHLPRAIRVPLHFIMTLFLSVMLLKMTIATLDFFSIGINWLQLNNEIGFMILVLILIFSFLILDELLKLITDTGGLISIFLNSMRNKYDVAKYIEDGYHSTIKASDFIKEDHVDNNIEINNEVETDTTIEIDNNIEINNEVETDTTIENDNNIEINNEVETDTIIENDEEMEIDLKAEICDFNFIDTDKLFAEFPSDPQEEVPMTNKTEDCSDQVLFTMGLKKPRKYDET